MGAPRWQHAVALTCWLFIQAAATSNTTSITTSTAVPAPTASSGSIFEIDVVFPRYNAEYEFINALPVVLALQNLQTAAEFGPFTLSWTIEKQGSSPVSYSSFSVSMDNVTQFTSKDGSPYLWINNIDTNTTQWDFIVNAGMPNPFNLQLWLEWNGCNAYNILQNYPFTIWPQWWSVPDRPNPTSLANVTGNCADLGAVMELTKTPTSNCPVVQTLPSQSASTCAVNLDAAAVSSVSSSASALLMSSTSTATSPTVSASSHSTSANFGAATVMPTQAVLLAAGIVGGMQYCLT